MTELEAAAARQERREQLKTWLATLEPEVQALGERYPPGCVFHVPGRPPLYLTGYRDDGVLVVSVVDPLRNYFAASSQREYVPVRDIEAPGVTVERRDP